MIIFTVFGCETRYLLLEADFG